MGGREISPWLGIYFTGRGAKSEAAGPFLLQDLPVSACRPVLFMSRDPIPGRSMSQKSQGINEKCSFPQRRLYGQVGISSRPILAPSPDERNVGRNGELILR